MALCSMIGGGISAVLGVVAGITMFDIWIAFLVAGVVAMCAGYSYNKLNGLTDNQGGSVTFVQCYGSCKAKPRPSERGDVKIEMHA